MCVGVGGWEVGIVCELELCVVAGNRSLTTLLKSSSHQGTDVEGVEDENWAAPRS